MFLGREKKGGGGRRVNLSVRVGVGFVFEHVSFKTGRGEESVMQL